jgi:hypothetical protein
MNQVKHRLLASPDLVAATVALCMPALLASLWLSPRAAIPLELPPLVLGAAEVREAIEAERALASRAPSSELALRRRALYDERNRAELGSEPRDAVEARRRELGRLLILIARDEGDDAIAAMRAADAERMIAALAGHGDPEERAAALGRFPAALARWGAVVGTRRVAPELVIRTLFAARWNLVHAREQTEGLEGVALRAYHGWLAFHGDAADLGLRLAALDAYAAAGGLHADEARGAFAWQAGEWDAAAAAFTRAHEATSSVRFRNHAQAAVEASLGAGGLPDEP